MTARQAYRRGSIGTKIHPQAWGCTPRHGACWQNVGGSVYVSITLDIYSHAMSRQDEEAALDAAGVVVLENF